MLRYQSDEFVDLPFDSQRDIINSLGYNINELLDNEMIDNFEVLLYGLGHKITRSKINEMSLLDMYNVIYSIDDEKDIFSNKHQYSIDQILRLNKRPSMNLSGSQRYWINNYVRQQESSIYESANSIRMDEYVSIRDNLGIVHKYMSDNMSRIDDYANKIDALIISKISLLSYDNPRLNLNKTYHHQYKLSTELLNDYSIYKGIAIPNFMHKDDIAKFSIELIDNNFTQYLKDIPDYYLKGDININNTFTAFNSKGWITNNILHKLTRLNSIYIEKYVNNIRALNHQRYLNDETQLLRKPWVTEEFKRLHRLYVSIPRRMSNDEILTYLRYRRTYSNNNKDRQQWNRFIQEYQEEMQFDFNYHEWDFRDGNPLGFARPQYLDSYIRWRYDNFDDTEYVNWNDEIDNFIRKRKINRDKMLAFQYDPNYNITRIIKEQEYREPSKITMSWGTQTDYLFFTEYTKKQLNDRIELPADFRYTDFQNPFVETSDRYILPQYMHEPHTEILHNYIGFDYWDPYIADINTRLNTFQSYIVASRNINRTIFVDQNIDNRIAIMDDYVLKNNIYMDDTEYNNAINYIRTYEELAINDIISEFSIANQDAIRDDSNVIDVIDAFNDPFDVHTAFKKQLAYIRTLNKKQKLVTRINKPIKRYTRAQLKAKIRNAKNREDDKKIEQQRIFNNGQKRLDDFYLNNEQLQIIEHVNNKPINPQPYISLLQHEMALESINLYDPPIQTNNEIQVDHGEILYKYMRKRKYKALYDDFPFKPKLKKPKYEYSYDFDPVNLYKFFLRNKMTDNTGVEFIIHHYFNAVSNNITYNDARMIHRLSFQYFYEEIDYDYASKSIKKILNNYVEHS